MQDPEHIQFKELVKTARDYCNLIDGLSGRDDWLLVLFQLLPRLHANVVAMPDPGGGEVTDQYSDLDDRFDLFSELRMRLGDRDMYWLEFDQPGDVHEDDEHRSGSLADDLTDIYCELKHGLKRFDDNDDAGRTLGRWRTGFCRHWGQHVVDAERHLYALSARDRLY